MSNNARVRANPKKTQLDPQLLAWYRHDGERSQLQTAGQIRRKAEQRYWSKQQGKGISGLPAHWPLLVSKGGS
jgi:hypothetical protein